MGERERGPPGRRREPSRAWKGRRTLSLLTINAGSSTIKTALFDDDASREIASALVEGTPDRAATMLDQALGSLAGRAPGDVASIRAVGHRVVHGGVEFREATRVDAGVKDAVRRFSTFAPLHNPPALAAIEAAERRFPKLPHVAGFDTAFFTSLEPRAFVYPLPYAWHTEWGIRRFGFHGLSHAYCSARAAEVLAKQPGPEPPPKEPVRLVILHLGNGCSASAVLGRPGGADPEPVATTMGFTPLEGLMMGTRSGSADPGILIHVMRERGLDVDSLDHALQHDSGLLGVSGVSGDFREVDAAARAGDERARLAIEIYADRARAAVGSLAVTMGGVDALVFTAGVGENARALRASVCHGLDCLGLSLDTAVNDTAIPDADVATASSAGRILVLRTREDLMLARETRRVLAA